MNNLYPQLDSESPTENNTETCETSRTFKLKTVLKQETFQLAAWQIKQQVSLFVLNAKRICLTTVIYKTMCFNTQNFSSK